MRFKDLWMNYYFYSFDSKDDELLCVKHLKESEEHIFRIKSHIEEIQTLWKSNSLKTLNAANETISLIKKYSSVSYMNKLF